MHQNQRQRFIQQICFSLELPVSATSATLSFYRQAINIENLNYQNQILVSACIFLACKVFEVDTKIRDIINMIFVITTLYKLSRNQSEHSYIDCSKVVKTENIHAKIEPSFHLNIYKQLKGKVLEAEQTLLRVIKYDFDQSIKKSSNFKQLLAVCDQLRFPNQLTEIAVSAYNDLQFCQNDVVQWIPGILYFSVEALEASGNSAMKLEDIEWQKLFLVPVKKLQKYSEKVIDYYERLNKEEMDE